MRSSLNLRTPPAPLRRNTMSLLVALVLCSSTAIAMAGTVPPGSSHIIEPGDAAEEWEVGDVGQGATLIMKPGAQAVSILGSGPSQITIEGGTVTTGRTSNNPNGWGVVSGTSGLLAITNKSEITGISGISYLGGPDLVTGGLRVSDSRVTGTDGEGIVQSAGNSIITGSEVTGKGAGLQVISYFDSTSVISRDSIVVIDGSTISSADGAAINVGFIEGYDPGRANSVITIRNGTQLVGGNGNALEVINGSAVDFTVDQSDISGDIYVSAGSTADVTLRNSATWLGKTSKLGSLALSTGARWTLTGSSDVGDLDLGSGSTLALGDGSAFNQLRVTGDYVGGGGTLLFNVVLGDDSSASDKLIVSGDTAGATNVSVNNIGGSGAQTVNGIALIEVGGASTGTFTLAGRAVGGQYEYFLHKGGVAAANGNWYLRSELPTPPDPCLADPTLPGCNPVVPPKPDPCLTNPSLPECRPVDPPIPPEPVLRPEPGAYLANQAASRQMFSMSLHDRTGGYVSGSAESGMWTRIARSQADYGVIGDQLGINGDTSVLKVGGDVLAWGKSERGRLGVMLGAGRANNNVSSRVSGYSAKGKVEGQAVGVSGTWQQDSRADSGLYVDAWLAHAQFKNTVQGSALAKERYKSRSNAASVEAGYAIRIGGGASASVFLEPQAQLGYTQLRTNSHTETNGTRIDEGDTSGFTSRVGWRLFGHSNAGAGNVVAPFVSANWIHESVDQGMLFDGEVLKGGVPRNRYEAKAGATLKLGERWTAWGDLGLQRGDGGYRDVNGQLGLRASW